MRGSPKTWLESPRPGFSVALNDTVAVTVLATNCANPAGVNVTASAGGVPIALTARGDGLYTGTYTPTAGGPVTLTATASIGALTDSQSAAGTVEGGYRVVEEPFSWVDATVGGTRLTLADDAQAAVALPFSFRYFGQPFSSVTVSSNGFLVFGTSAATAWVNAPLPNTAAPNGVVAAYWDDLNPALGGSIWHRTLGTTPNRKLVISWIGIRHADTPGPISFQATLEEGSNEILLAYQDTLHGNTSHDHGNSATIGLESPDGTIGSQFLHNQPLLAPYQATTALRYTDRPLGPADTQAPAVPSGLIATAGELSVSLTWSANTEPDLAGYRLYKQATDGSWALLATTITAAYTQTGLPAGSPASYRVTAFDRATPANESAPSATASATPLPDLTPPSAPSGLQAAAGDRQVTLDWADNTDAVAGYRVYRNGSPVATPTGSGYTDTGLTNGSTYTYRVTALDQAGNESAPSNQISASPQAPVTPPDETSYRLLQEPFSWVDATAGGTQLTLADDAQAAVALPFSFRYYGQPFSSVTVSSNGFLVFGTSAATAWVNGPLPEHRRPQRRRRRLLGRPQPSPRRQHLAPHPRHHPQPQTRHQLDRHPPRRHPRPDQLPSRARRRQQRDPARLPRHAAREPPATTTAPPPPSESNHPTARSAANSSTTNPSSAHSRQPRHFATQTGPPGRRRRPT